MKVFVGELVIESNTDIPTICTIKQYDIGLGRDCIQKTGIRGVFEKNGVTLTPSIYASAGATGVVEKSTLTYIEHMFIDTLKKNLHKIDGIFLMLHGVSKVEELGFEDHHTLKELRKLAGPYLPTTIICGPHGNLCKEYVEPATILRSYRESLHTDADETMEKVVEILRELLKKRRNIHTVYHKLPLILGGEQSISADGPVLPINRYTDELKEDGRILSCSWHAGYIRYDRDVAGCDIIAIPYGKQNLPHAQKAVDRLAAYVWEKCHELHYIGLITSPSKALQMTLDFQDEPVFIMGSDDDVTSGITGRNTGIPRQVPQTETTKKFLFATICDPAAYQTPSTCKIGEELSFTLGVGFDELSSAVEPDAAVKSSGNLIGFMMCNHTSVFGHCVNVHIKGTSVDIMVTDTGQAAYELHQFVNTGIDVNAYDVIVVKQGYIFPDLKTKGKLCVMSLTEGAVLQDTTRLPFKRITRPMFPIDDI